MWQIRNFRETIRVKGLNIHKKKDEEEITNNFNNFRLLIPEK